MCHRESRNQTEGSRFECQKGNTWSQIHRSYEEWLAASRLCPLCIPPPRGRYAVLAVDRLHCWDVRIKLGKNVTTSKSWLIQPLDGYLTTCQNCSYCLCFMYSKRAACYHMHTFLYQYQPYIICVTFSTLLTYIEQRTIELYWHLTYCYRGSKKKRGLRNSLW